MPMSRTTLSLAAVAVALCVASCGRNERPSHDGTAGGARVGESRPGDAPARRPRPHWVQDERLRGVMAELSRQSANWPAGLPDDPESDGGGAGDAFRDAGRLADGLARAARDIPRAVAGREMDRETRRGFNSEARRLREQAQALGRAARGRRVERMQRLLDGISSSCVHCHSQYRDFSGELGAGRASAE